jgi:hypothetical protein
MSEHSHRRWNYSVLLVQGIANNSGYRLTSEKLVLPFLYSTLGAPIFFAGLLVPIAAVSKLVIQILAASVIRSAEKNKWFIAASAVVWALALTVITTTVNGVAVGLVIPIFAIVSVVLGAVLGVSSLTVQNLVGKIFDHRVRSRLMFTQSSLAGLLAVVIMLGSLFILPPLTSNAAHQELIWLGIALTLISAVLCIIIREPADPPTAENQRKIGEFKNPFRDLRSNFKITFALPWFRRFLIARSLILSVELSMPFFAIHAASFHADSTNGLTWFVIASSLGLVVGGVVWPRISRDSVHVLLVLGTCIACLGGVLALAIELQITPPSIFVYALVFVLISLGSQATRNGRKLYLLNVTTKEQRPICIAMSNVVIGGMSIAFGAILGALAGFQGVAWPIVVLVVLNVATGIFVFSLKDAHGPEATTGDKPNG